MFAGQRPGSRPGGHARDSGHARDNWVASGIGCKSAGVVPGFMVRGTPTVLTVSRLLAGWLVVTVGGRSWVGGSSRDRRRSCRSRRPPEVMLRPRQPREARSRTAQTRVRQLVSPGSRPMTLVRRRVSPKMRSMKLECRNPVMVLSGEPQVGAQALLVSGQGLHRRGAGGGVPAGHLADPGIDDLHELRAGWGFQLPGVEDLPVGVLDLGLHPGRDLREDVSRPVDQASLAQGLGVRLLDRGDQPGRAVGYDQQRGGQAAVFQIGQEGVPGVGGLAGARRQADERGLAIGGDAPGGEHRLGR